MDVLEGGCLCGAIRYRITGPARVVAVCHCRSCRLASGAPMVAWATFEDGAVDIDREALRWHASSDHARRGSCPRCGSALLFQSRRYPRELDVTVASLDDPEALPPERHIFWPEHLRWLRLSDGLPRHAGDSGSAEVL